jgi:peptidoglycan/xylan/chitin deacetylase (PgdA/CDA1 family)
MFYLDDVQADWLESVSVDPIDLHMKEKTPMILGVIPGNLDNPNVGGGYLPNLLKRINENESDLFEIGQHGYTHADLKGKSCEEQKEIIQKGLAALTSIGIKPVTFIPPFGSPDVARAHLPRRCSKGNSKEVYCRFVQLSQDTH